VVLATVHGDHFGPSWPIFIIVFFIFIGAIGGQLCFRIFPVECVERVLGMVGWVL
jgi:hypothetical protein